jgi:hypothetical protein
MQTANDITFMDRLADLGAKAAMLCWQSVPAPPSAAFPAATYGGNPTTHGGPTGCLSVLDFFKSKGITPR